MRGRRVRLLDRQRLYRAIEAEAARESMDAEVERRRRAGLLAGGSGSTISLPSAAPLKISVNPSPPTLDQLVEVAVRALRGDAVRSPS